jgi:hypothetical protein
LIEQGTNTSHAAYIDAKRRVAEAMRDLPESSPIAP